MTPEEAVNYFLSTDGMRQPVTKTIEVGRILATAYKESLVSLVSNINDISILKGQLAIEKEARNKDNAFNNKELANLRAQGVGSSQTIVAPIISKLLEIENLILKQRNK